MPHADGFDEDVAKTGRLAQQDCFARPLGDAAKIAGLASGNLALGSVADICLFDPVARWKVEAKALASQGKHTPFLGYELPGQVKTTIVAGHIVFTR